MHCSLCKRFLLSLVVIAASVTAAAQESQDSTHDGLTRVDRTRADEVYVLPEADFSVYDSFIIDEPVVAFRKNWQRDFDRQTSQRRLRDEDIERIKDGMKVLFLEVFSQDLEAAGYSLVVEPGENVMVLRPSIIDLDVAAPDLPSADINRSYITSAGSARLYIEFFDSVTGQILARATDFQRARTTNNFQWATAASNRAEAREVLRRWAGMLVDKLDEIHGK